MLRIALLVSLLALLLTACIQPTPTPAGTSAPVATDGSGYPAVQPTNTPPAAYPAVQPSATPSDYPAPSSRPLPALKFGAAAAAYR